MSEIEVETPTTRPKQFILRTDPHKFRRDPSIWNLSEVHEVIEKWKPQSEMWPFRYGIGVLAAASSASAMYVNWHFRDTLLLLNSSRVTSYLAMVGVPGFSAAALHYFMVMNPILDQSKSCSVCLQVRGMTIQGATSFLYPLVVVPLICYPIAKKLKSYSVPNLSIKNPLPVIEFTREVLKPIRVQLWTIIALQVLLGAATTYTEQLRFASHVKPYMDKTKAKQSPFDPRIQPGWEGEELI